VINDDSGDAEDDETTCVKWGESKEDKSHGPGEINHGVYSG